jgi:hypothetical protein
MIDDVFKAPIERAYEAIVISLMIPALAPVHVVLPESHEPQILRHFLPQI